VPTQAVEEELAMTLKAIAVPTILVLIVLLTSCNTHKPSDHKPETATREDGGLTGLRAKRVFFTADIIPDVSGAGWPAEVVSVPKGAYVFYAHADVEVPTLKSYQLRFKVYDGASKLVSNQRGFFEPQKKVGQVRVQGGEDVMILTGKTYQSGTSPHEFLVSNSASIDGSSVPGKWKVEFFLDDQKIGEGEVLIEGNP
jgi:hypothetical protein